MNLTENISFRLAVLDQAIRAGDASNENLDRLYAWVTGGNVAQHSEVRNAATGQAISNPAVEAVKAASTRKPKPEPQQAVEPPAPAPQPEPEAPAPAPAAEEPQTAPAVTYEDLQKSVAKAVARDPNIVRAVLGELGLSTFKGSDASVWPVAKEKLDAKVAAYA